MYNGIDVSKWQGDINWTKVKNAGIEFVIIRDGWGKSSPTQVDKKFKDNYKNAKSLDIPVGVYHYSYADSVSDARQEALFCLDNISGMQLEYPVCFDIEDPEMYALSTELRTEICRAFCSEIENHGYYAMIYCNYDWYVNRLQGALLAQKYDIWLAQWSGNTPLAPCGIWQHSESGKIDGINSNVDLDIAYKNYPSIIKESGLNGFSSSGSETKPTYFNYTVKSGDNLWSIAQVFLKTGSNYVKIKQLNNLTTDVIYPGQILKIPYSI
ncbi:MAG: glycosyl hydrolase family 25 [Candidatus Improbicoccus devescovinae]|nr:MAG: glycosyl hydrolase family 25 [Candidatus Improbicoccus devescovinae]